MGLIFWLPFATHPSPWCSIRVDPVTMLVSQSSYLKHSEFCHVGCNDGYDMVPTKRESMLQLTHTTGFDATNSPGVTEDAHKDQDCLTIPGRCRKTGRCPWCAMSTVGHALGWCCKKFDTANGCPGGMIGGDLFPVCVRDPVYQCSYTFPLRGQAFMAYMPDPRCGFEDQIFVEEPMYYAQPLTDSPFAGHFAGDKGYMPSVNDREAWPSKRDCGAVSSALEFSWSKCYASTYADRVPSIGLDKTSFLIDGNGGPVVILGGLDFDKASGNLGDTAMVAVHSVASNNFEVKVWEVEDVDCGAGAADGQSSNEIIYGYFAQMPGVYSTGEDVTYEIGLLEVVAGKAGESEVKFQSEIRNAVVFLTPQGPKNSAEWLAIRIKEVTSWGFKYTHRRMQVEWLRSSSEKVGWIAVPGGIGTIYGRRYMAATTSKAVLDGAEYTVSDGNIVTWSSAPALFTFMQTTNEADPAVLRTSRSVGAVGEFSVVVQEASQCGSDGVRLQREKLGYLLVDLGPPQEYYVADAGQICIPAHQIPTEADCEKAYEAIRTATCCTNRGHTVVWDYDAAGTMQKPQDAAEGDGIPLGCSIRHKGPDVDIMQKINPYFNTLDFSDNSRMGTNDCASGSLPCDEFRALCMYGVPLGVPPGLEHFSTALAGENATTDTLFAFNGERLGAKVPKTKTQMQQDCIAVCRGASPDYKYYILSDRNACLCAKQNALASGEDDTMCHENEIWAMTVGPGPGTSECGTSVTTRDECENTLGCCFDDARIVKCVYPRLVAMGKESGRCIRCDEDNEQCWSAKLCYPRYCPYPARGRMPWTHILGPGCASNFNSTTGIRLGEVCGFQCRDGFISAGLDYECAVTKQYVGDGQGDAIIAMKQSIAIANVPPNSTKHCIVPEDVLPLVGTKLKLVPLSSCGGDAKKFNLPPESVGRLQYRSTPLDASTGLCVSGDYDNDAVKLTLESCLATDPKQKWFLPDAEGRIRSGGAVSDGSDRKCLTPEMDDATGIFWIVLKVCPFWYDNKNVVYYQETDTEKSWSNSISNFGVNMKVPKPAPGSSPKELVCRPQVCLNNKFPRTLECDANLANQRPPECLDPGMGHTCGPTRVGSSCFVYCAPGYSLKCYADSTFGALDITDPSNCPNYRCPALTLAPGTVEHGLSGPLATRILANVVKQSNIIRCEPQPCVITSDPAFRIKGARSDCTYLIGVGTANPTGRDKPPTSANPPTKKTALVVGEICQAQCDYGFFQTKVMYKCAPTLQFVPDNGAAEIVCEPKTCFQLPDLACIPKDALAQMKLPFLSELVHSSGFVMCTETIQSTGRFHGSGKCFSFFIDNLNQEKIITSTDDTRLNGETFAFATVPAGCTVKMTATPSPANLVGPTSQFGHDPDNPGGTPWADVSKISLICKEADPFGAKFRDDPSFFTGEKIDLELDPGTGACGLRGRYGEGVDISGCETAQGQLPKHGDSCPLSCRNGYGRSSDSYDTFLPGYVEDGAATANQCRVALYFRDNCVDSNGDMVTVTDKQECEGAGCCWAVKDPEIFYLSTIDNPACWEHNLPKANRKSCKDVNGDNIGDGNECELNGCCFDDTVIDVALQCYHRAIYDKDICHAKRHATDSATCRFVGENGYVVSASYPFIACTRRECPSFNIMRDFEWPLASATKVNLITHLFFMQNTDQSTTPWGSGTQTASQWRIKDGGNNHPCFQQLITNVATGIANQYSLMTGDRCVASCDTANDYAGTNQAYQCQWDAGTNSMRLKGIPPAYRGGPLCSGTSGHQDGVSEPLFPCPANDYLAGFPTFGGQQADCMCCIQGLCSTESHPELQANKVVARNCFGLTIHPGDSTPFMNANKCQARCASGYGDKYGRNPVEYICPAKDYERGEDFTNASPIHVIPNRDLYQGDTWRNSAEGVKAGGQDLTKTERIVQCVPEACVEFDHTDLETARTHHIPFMALYDTTFCAVPGNIYEVEEYPRTQCLVYCGQGYQGKPMAFTCAGTNDPLTVPPEPPKAKFRGIEQQEPFGVHKTNKPSCAPKKCSVYSSLGVPLPSPQPRYEIANPTKKAPNQSGSGVTKCGDQKTEVDCTLQCKKGFTPANVVAYICMNRNYNDPTVGAEMLFEFVPKTWFEQVVGHWPAIKPSVAQLNTTR